MSIKRFDFVGWEEMDESPTGEFVRLEDIIEIIERCPRVDDDYMILCDARHLIALLKGEYK